MSNQLQEWRQKAQELLGASNPIDWVSESRGYINCPLEDYHTTKKGPRDTVIYLEGFPHIFCLHESCHEDLREINRMLRLYLTGQSHCLENFARSPIYRIADSLRQNREAVIKKYTPRVRFLEGSNTRAFNSSAFLYEMFKPKDLIWIGQPEMTGPGWQNNFREAWFWRSKDIPPAWKFICPNPLHGCDRRNENIVEYRYLVLESDTLSLLETRAMFEAVEDILLLKLKAIVFSGNKSLHGWFVHPGLEWLQENKPLLVALGFDAKTMCPSQPVRLPGVIRENGKKQELLWINQR